MPSDLALKVMNTMHRGVLKLSGGRVGWEASNMPVVELTTTGRKSGEPRTVMLTSPLQEDDIVVVVASRAGDDQNPAWFLNIGAEPKVVVRFKGGPRQPMTARAATAEERARMWPLITEVHENYAGYQKKTAREIPLVLLEPVV